MNLESPRPGKERAADELTRLRVERDVLRRALDYLAFGVAVSVDGETAFANHSARALLSSRVEIVDESNGGAGRRTTVAHAVKHHAEQRTATTLTLTRPETEQQFHVFILPIDARSSTAVFLCDPGRRVHASEDALRNLYGMTSAEARLAGELANGASLEEAATHLGVKPNTARSHLKKVFAKTHTKRQGDLVRILTATFAALALE